MDVTRRGDPKPPFLILADVGHRLWIWSSFSRDDRDDYGNFEPTAAFSWDDLEKPEVFHLLRQIWLSPGELDEEARGQRITAKIAELVSDLAVRLEKRFEPEDVGNFLMKCVFTMFAEDVGFLPLKLFTNHLETWEQKARKGDAKHFVRGLRTLWTRMRDGGDLESGDVIRHFNGYLFRDPSPLALDADEIGALHTAAMADWRRVSPAIFGTLLERALSKDERQKLGAYYTPEAYIRRIVERTIMAPLRAEWNNTRAEMELRLRQEQKSKKPSPKTAKKATEEALRLGQDFRRTLASVRVLDPACGSGNFLYVALKEMKRLEGEVLRHLSATGDQQEKLDIPGETVHPEQFHGVEIKPWAAKIAELVLWIGYLQWQVSAGRLDRMPPPLLQDLQHIKNTDALISFSKSEPLLDEQGQPAMRARGVTDKKAQRELLQDNQLLGVKQAAWPEADFIVGNPPFLGNKRLSDVLGAGYTRALREAYPEVPGSADLVMYWWWRCAELTKNRAEQKAAKPGKADLRTVRFGLVTTNSITQPLNRSVVAEAAEKKGVRLVYAIPDHPWYDEGAAVRIAMTVGATTTEACLLGQVVDQQKTKAAELESVRVVDSLVSEIHADLSAGAKATAAVLLQANARLAYQGVNPVGEGFRLSPAELKQAQYSPDNLPPVIRRYLIGHDLVQAPIERYIIDFWGVDPKIAEKTYPVLWDRVVRLVKPKRDANNRPSRKKNWHLFGEPVEKLRVALAGLKQYIATCRTAKHRLFVFVPADTLPDTKLVAIAIEDAAMLATLSSRIHLAWADRTKGMLEDRPTYNHTESFGKFPFPSLTTEQHTKLRALGERLDSHRKARQAAHPKLTLTGMYNVLEKLRADQPLSPEEVLIQNQGLLATLRQIHIEIDEAVMAAYGWQGELSDEQIIQKLVDLNAERAAEEGHGAIRWLRPEHQATGAQAEITEPDEPEEEPTSTKKPARPKGAVAQPWPADLPGRIRVLTDLLRKLDEPTTASLITMVFKGAKLDDVILTLQCAAAADAVMMTETEDGETAWAPLAV